MSRHIKRDGAFMCNARYKPQRWTKYDGFVRFTYVHKMNIEQMQALCADCIEEYTRRMDNMDPVIIE